jgi:chromate reductase
VPDQSPSAIRIALVQGSVRPGNYTAKALALVADELSANRSIQVDIIDPTGVVLPMPGSGTDSPEAERFAETIRNAVGVVLATPEYHGSYSSVIKLVIENLGFPSGLAGKPVALLGVAAGQIGAIKVLEHLRSVCSHIGSIVLPGPVSVAAVQEVFDEAGKCLDASTEKRIRGLATHLIDYIEESVCPRFCLEEFVRERAA